MIESIISEYVTTWKLAMISALVLMMATKADRGQKVRVWLVMMAASFAGYIYQSVGYFMVIEGIAAMIIMWPPKNNWQRSIGAIFAAMLLCTIAFGALQNFSSVAPDPILLKAVHDGLAWLAVLLLFGWSGDGLCADNSIGGRLAGGLLPSLLWGSRRQGSPREKD